MIKSQDNPVIKLENVTIKYRVPISKSNSLKAFVIKSFKNSMKYQEFKALENLNLKIYEGEAVGIIGSNGSGKTTILKLISRVLKPSTGRIYVKGRVAPLLALGAGFNPEFSGLENIFLNGTILGLNENEIKERLKSILDFADIGDFIDSPIRNYSSGMQARLGFSVATNVDPDILLVDEVLTVGDENFQKKASQKIAQFQDQGVSIVLVSHSMETIRSICSRVIWLSEGKIIDEGKPEKIITKYLKGNIN